MQEFDTLADLSRVQAREFPNAKALILGNEILTYQQLDRESDRIANALLAQGIKERSRVAILAKDSPKSYEVLFACATIKPV